MVFKKADENGLDPNQFPPLDATEARKRKRNPPMSEYVKPPRGSCPSDQYKLLFHVANNPAGYDKTHAQKKMREDWDRNPLQYRSMLMDLEDKHSREKLVGTAMDADQQGDGEILEKDIGVENARALIKQLQDSFDEEENEYEKSKGNDRRDHRVGEDDG